MNVKKYLFQFIAFDTLSAAIAWTLFFIYRKAYIEPIKFGYRIPFDFNETFYKGLIIIPAFWIFLYYIFGFYKNSIHHSRLQDFWITVKSTFVGVLVIFFVSILDDTIVSYKNYYSSFFTLLGLHFSITYIPRLILATIINNKIHRKEIGFNTLIIGSYDIALRLYKQFESAPEATGNLFVGFVGLKTCITLVSSPELHHLGTMEEVQKIISDYKVVEVIVALEPEEHNELDSIIDKIEFSNVCIKVIPSMYEIVTGMVRMSTIHSVPLIEINHDLMPLWEEKTKRCIDIAFSLFALLLLTPLFIMLGIGIKCSSKGSIFYKQERIGKYGKPFWIYKFRSMYNDAEKNGPALASDNDCRITKLGLIMRKFRLDELPQFYNVLIGNMSLVGPRPERQYFIDKIVKKAPHYRHLHKVRPGITSWGQVKYGYAENVDEMVERLKYDIIYIENMSLYLDFKIMIYTALVMLKAEGK